GIVPGQRVTVIFGETGTQRDHEAEVLAVDDRAHPDKVKVRALERTPKGLRKTVRWTSSKDVFGHGSERWPDGTRVFGGSMDYDRVVMVIDRVRDPHLRRFLDEEITPLKATFGGDHLGLVDAVVHKVRKRLSYNSNTDDKVADREVLLGDYLAA